MRDLLRDDLGVQRVDVLVLRSEVHCANADLMHIRVLHDFLALHGAEVVVKDGHSEEVRPDGALEGGSDFNHPVYHLCAILLADVVGVQGARVWSLIESHQILMDLREERQLIVFFLLWRGLLGAAQALISLLLCIDRACVTGSATHILHLDDSHGVVVILEELLVVAGAARDVTTHAPISTIFLDSIDDSVDGIDFVLAAFLSPDVLHSVFIVACYVALRRLSAHLVGGSCVRVLLRLL